MRQAMALALKLMAYLMIFGVTLPMFGLVGLAQSMVLAAVMTLLLWLADMVVLPRFGTGVTTVADFLALVVLTPLVLGPMFAFPRPLGVTLATVAATAFEWWFHRYLTNRGILMGQ